MLARLFSARLRGDLTWDEFRRFAAVIEHAFINDINGLLEEVSDDLLYHTSPYAKHFYHLGLSKLKINASALALKYSHTEPKELKKIEMDPFGEFVEFELIDDAYVLVQILIGRKINNYDFLGKYREHRHFRDEL